MRSNINFFYNFVIIILAVGYPVLVRGYSWNYGFFLEFSFLLCLISYTFFTFYVGISLISNFMYQMKYNFLLKILSLLIKHLFILNRLYVKDQFMLTSNKNQEKFVSGMNRNYTIVFNSIKRRYNTSNHPINLNKYLEKIKFDSDIINFRLNSFISDNDLISFSKDESSIYNYLVSKRINITLDFVSDIYDIPIKSIKVIQEENLYTFYDIEKNILLYSVYFFYKKKFHLSLKDNYYLIYSMYHVHDNYSFDDLPEEINYRCIYIYYDLNNSSFLYNVSIDNDIFNALCENDKRKAAHESDFFLYQSLLDMIVYLNTHKIILLPLNSSSSSSKKECKKKNLLSNFSRKFHTNISLCFESNNFYYSKTKLVSILDTNTKIYGFIKFKYIKYEELCNFFHPDLISIRFFDHRWLLYDNISLSDEDGNLREGFVLSSVTSHTSKGEISVLLKNICSSFYNNHDFRLYYLNYFIDYNSDLKNIFVKIQKTNNINFTLVHHYMENALARDMAEIRCAQSNKKMFSHDNYKYSKLKLDKNKSNLTDFSDLYCYKDGTCVSKKQVLPSLYIDKQYYPETKISSLHIKKDNEKKVNFDCVLDNDYDLSDDVLD